MKKKLLTILLACMLSMSFTACSDGNSENAEEANTSEDTNESTPDDNTEPEEEPQEEKTYSIGEAWTVDGQWSLTVNSITPTDQRNEYADKNPAQVFIVDYTYENLGFTDESGLMNGVYFDLSSGQIVDSNGTMGYSYPGDVSYYPQEAPVGANCQAQACIGVDNESTEIKITISQYDGTGTNQTATFIIPVS